NDDASPAVGSARRRDVRAAGDHGNDARNTQLDRFLEGKLERSEFDKAQTKEKVGILALEASLFDDPPDGFALLGCNHYRGPEPAASIEHLDGFAFFRARDREVMMLVAGDKKTVAVDCRLGKVDGFNGHESLL